MGNLKDTTPDAIRAEIERVGNEARVRFGEAVEEGREAIRVEIETQRVAAELVAEIAALGATALIAQATVALVEPFACTTPIELRTLRVDTDSPIGGWTGWTIGEYPCGKILAPPGLYRAVFLLIPIDKPAKG